MWEAGGEKGLILLQPKGAGVGKTDLMSSSCTPHSPKTSVTFTNTYINTLHTIASLGGRLPTEARLTQLHVSDSRKGAGLPEMGSMWCLLPRVSPAPAHPSLQVQFVQYGELP